MHRTSSAFHRTAAAALAGALAGIGMGASAASDAPGVTVASTTSTESSGLFDALLPMFTEATGIEVRVVAVGTGQAIRLARNGDADVLLVHHRPSEEQFVADGDGVKRYPVMHNDFVIVGPAADPAGISGTSDASAALRRIGDGRFAFVSRGDESGTHKTERTLWDAAGVDPSAVRGGWYREAGSGMGATLNVASAMQAYTLSDRATWLRFANKGELAVLVEGDPRLFNAYSAILVNPGKHPHVRAAEGQAFIDWLVSADGQRAIGAYRIDGRQAFFPDALPEAGPAPDPASLR